MKLSTKTMVIIMGISILLAAASYLLTPAVSKEENAATPLKTETLVITTNAGRQHTFNVEIAATPVDLEIGLMYRKQLAQDGGMLFEMGAEQMTRFWMKNTFIPLDMLFIGADGEIKTLHENAEPHSLEGVSSEVPVTAVLELNGGRARALGIQKGDRVLHAYFSTEAK
jgi:hypothetical protein